MQTLKKVTKTMASDDNHRTIGKVVLVSADRFVVELNRATDNFTVVGFDDVHYVARLGSFVLIPVKSEYVVSEVVGLREKDPRTHRIDDGELDKISSAKYLDLVPVGMLQQEHEGSFRFGVSTYPSLYTDALYILHSELDRVFEVSGWEEKICPENENSPTRYKALTIGTSVVFEGYEVKVRIDDYFGGHVAVLGNTGSGKSCTVATIAQSLFEKANEYVALGATFIFLDVNGEYRQAFSKLPKSINRFYLKVSENPSDQNPVPLDSNEKTKTFRLPHWFMSVEEWELLLRASERTQQPVLRTALGLSTLFIEQGATELENIRNHILASYILYVLSSDASSPTKKDRIEAMVSTFASEAICPETVSNMIKIDYGEMAAPDKLAIIMEGHIGKDVDFPDYTNSEFEFEDLVQALDLALCHEEAHGNRQIRDYCAQMLTRLKWIKNREEFAFLRVSPKVLTKSERQLDYFIEEFLGLHRKNGNYQKQAQIIILDMNETPDEVVEVVAAVMARLVFDRLRKADPRNRMPINFVLEEAHRYVAERPSRYAVDASRIFERIAKEGRKYGVLLTVASQRPSELSTTALSQCSNFVVHRIQNPEDLSHIRQMTPFISESVLKRLPSLPKQHALIFGNAVNVPTTFKVRDVHPAPKSADAPISELWFKPTNALVEMKFPSPEK